LVFQGIPAGRALLVASLVDPPSVDGAEVAALAGRADVLEVRADRVGDLPADWLRQRFPGSLLYTLRSRAEGGQFSGPRERRRRRLAEGAAGYDLVDLEGDRDLAPELLEAVAPERRILSWHGAAADLPSLRARFSYFAATPAALYKLVPAALHSGEELTPLALLADLRRRDVLAFAGGEIGTWTRRVAPRLGAPVLFAAAGRSPAAPGQLALERLRRDYGLPALPPARHLCGIVGRPALGSLSPRLHNAAYRALGVPALYVPFEVEHFGDFWLEVVETDLPQRLGLPLAGLSVTTPHKDVAFAVAGATSPLAQRLQACNTLTPRDGVWEGESTDAEGVVEALRRRGVDPRGRTAAVLGCGGAGRAAALGLAVAGARVALVNRGAERGLAAAKSLGLPFVPWAELDPPAFDLFVHATPLGRDPADELPLALGRLRAGSAVVDLVYGEEPTRLVAESARRGLVAIDGREVLLRQAVPQFRAMTGRELPVAVAARALGLDGEAA
jgi:3-dehydroquinate dehydratase/shikimate dehydrogenase